MPSLLPPLVAIVDDEESVRRAMGRLVRAAGYSVETFSAGSDFLRAMSQRTPQCVLLDLRMPHMSGLDVLQALRRAALKLPVVVMTGDDSAGDRVRAMEAGAQAFLRKPIDESALVEAIRAAIVDPVHEGA